MSASWLWTYNLSNLWASTGAVEKVSYLLKWRCSCFCCYFNWHCLTCRSGRLCNPSGPICALLLLHHLRSNKNRKHCACLLSSRFFVSRPCHELRVNELACNLYGFWETRMGMKVEYKGYQMGWCRMGFGGWGNPNRNLEIEDFLFLAQCECLCGLVSPYLYCYALIICLQTTQKQREIPDWFVFKGSLSGAGSEKEGFKRGIRGFFVCAVCVCVAAGRNEK